jgi:sulfur-oxidizing protein SoxA
MTPGAMKSSCRDSNSTEAAAMTIRTFRFILGFALKLSFFIWVACVAAEPANKEVTQYRDMLSESNPAELYISAGEEKWNAPAGPKKSDLKDCDLGLGPGKLDGAAAQLPRYFKDTHRVQDLESRLMTCMSQLQGIAEQSVIDAPFGSEAKKDIDDIVAYVASRSRGFPIRVDLHHPKEQAFYAMGKRAFYTQAGPYDFSCASCHSQEAKRIRLQELPNLTSREGAAAAWGSWPAYRVSNGQFWTMQHRLNDCLRQQRWPYPLYGSDLTIALSLFMAANANGGLYQAPGLKR